MQKHITFLIFLVSALILQDVSSHVIRKQATLESHFKALIKDTAQWKEIDGTASDIGVGADGTLWAVGTNAVDGGYGIYRRNRLDTEWENISGGLARIAVAPDGNAWGGLLPGLALELRRSGVANPVALR